MFTPLVPLSQKDGATKACLKDVRKLKIILKYLFSSRRRKWVPLPLREIVPPNHNAYYNIPALKRL